LAPTFKLTHVKVLDVAVLLGERVREVADLEYVGTGVRIDRENVAYEESKRHSCKCWDMNQVKIMLRRSYVAATGNGAKSRAKETFFI
jgi:hypothetical protein